MGKLGKRKRGKSTIEEQPLRRRKTDEVTLPATISSGDKHQSQVGYFERKCSINGSKLKSLENS